MPDPILATKNLSLAFGALKAVDGVSLDLRPGEIHALIGPNGAGKSTFIGLVSGALRPDAGRVTFLGQDVTGQGVAQRAQAGLGRTFQISALAMGDTVFENAMLGAIGALGAARRCWSPAIGQSDLKDRAETALARTGLSSLATTRCADLSHGQRRQLEIAVALTLAPRAFIMDEPMAGLGTEGSARMTVFLEDLRAEAPILLVEHDMDAVFRLADRISVLAGGRLVATGTTAEIRASAEVREAYLGDEA